MIRPIVENVYAGLDLSVFEHNLELPRHRWYDFKEGFSQQLVRVAIDDISSGSRRKLKLLDPFAGSGTTLVTAGQLGLEAAGIEVNPFLAFVAKAKSSPNSWRLKDFRRRMEKILDSSRHEIPSSLEGISTFTESPRLKKWLFNRSVLRGFATIDAALSTAGKYRAPLRLALFASLMECCNAKRDGKCLRYRKDWESLGFNSATLRKAFVKRTQIIFDDITEHDFVSDDISVVRGDARDKLKHLPTGKYDLLVTSPPYLNSFDYSDVYRPELFAGRFVRNNAELRRIRLKTVRSHLQVAWVPSTTISSPLILPILSRLAEQELWNQKIPEMVQSYFSDMSVVLREAARVVKPRGRAWIVVSTSAYGGIEIPVDLILADIASRNGWRLIGVNVLRQLRSAGQHWSHLEAMEKLPLRESLIILERISKR
jgi:DNA modification methylase